MKVHISYNFIEDPWGGGNQFLKALRKQFEGQGFHERDADKADLILFNSHHNLERCLDIKRRYPDKAIVHRIDGPISLVRGKDREVDEIIRLFNHLFGDGIIFQSNWCMRQNKENFNIHAKYETVIHNAPDNEIFNKNGKTEFDPNRVKFIASSWSPNWRKGFEYYQFLDENLDFAKYDLTFVGNSPVEFKNVKHIRPVPTEKLAEIMKEHDIFITASQKDPCSNILIEALSCGLPAVVLNDGGHPELLKGGGELFTTTEELIAKIEKVTANYSYYQSRIPEFSINKVAKEYYNFACRIYSDIKGGRYRPNPVNFTTRLGFYRMKLMILLWKASSKLRAAKDRIF